MDVVGGLQTISPPSSPPSSPSLPGKENKIDGVGEKILKHPGPVDNKDEQIQNLRDALTRLGEEKAELEKGRNAALGAKDGEIQNLKGRITQLGQEKTVLEENQNAALGAKDGEIQNLTDQLARLNQEKDQLEKDKNAALGAKDDEIQSLKNDLARLNQEKGQGVKKTQASSSGGLWSVANGIGAMAFLVFGFILGNWKGAAFQGQVVTVLSSFRRG